MRCQQNCITAPCHSNFSLSSRAYLTERWYDVSDHATDIMEHTTAQPWIAAEKCSFNVHDTKIYNNHRPLTELDTLKC